MTRPLLARDFNAKIDIRRPVDVDDGHGGTDTSWADVALGVSAEVTPLDGRESVMNKVLESVSVYRVRIRYRAGILPTWQLRLDGQLLNIRSAVDPDRRHRQLHIIADNQATI